MLNAYERHVFVSYIANALRSLEHRREGPVKLAEWLTDNAHLLAAARVEDGTRKTSFDQKVVDAACSITDGHPGRGIGSRTVTAASRKARHRLQSLFEQECKATKSTAPDETAQRLQRLGEAAGLSEEDVRILQALLHYETHPLIEDMIDALIESEGNLRHHRLNLRSGMFAKMLGLSANGLRQRFADDAPLVRSGMVSIDDQEIVVSNRLCRLTSVGVTGDQTDVRRLLFGETLATELEWTDFDHLGQARSDAEHLLRGALERGARGVNILFHGPPGTGKTTLCQVLTQHVGAQLVSIGESNEYGGEPSRRERLGELKLAQCLFGGDGNTVLLFDEMDDLLSNGGLPFFFLGPRLRRKDLASPSKVFLNRLLEETKVPILWTTNAARHMDRALLRRVTYAVEMRQPPPRIRARIWERQLALHNIGATPADALTLAHEFDASPGVAAGATTAADLCDGDIKTVRRSVRSLSRVLGRDKPPFNPPARFDASILTSDVDLAGLVDRLERSGERRFSICLEGPPGTGKSAFVRYLADRMGMEVLHKRASDLFDMFVGQTEHNIANAFAEARDDEAFLVFDEADSLLADRRGAHRNWEVSQVNEMLTWMESHPLPFACTTNYGDKLDSAVLRRFVFKVTLGYLTPDRAATAFRSYFGLEPPRELAALQVLTPGDFAVVRRKAEVLGQLDDAHALTSMLRTECDAKPDRRTAIGFGR